MNEQWFRDYILLAFRIDKIIRKFTESRFVDYYYGPSEWKTAVESEPEIPPLTLIRDAGNLADALAEQPFEAHRATYLAKQVLALETICRKLNGEKFSLEEEVQRCFDIRPAWIPEAQFELAHALYEEALPGNESVVDCIRAWRKRYELVPEKSRLLLDFVHRAMSEARRRAQMLVNLPRGEGVEVQTVSGQPGGGENWYLGNYRSRIEVNTDLPTNLAGILDLVCHEGYPGHHVEFVLKEEHVYRERGYLEQAIAPIIAPQSVISEGIATLACEMIFAPGEAEQWIAEQIYPEAGVEVDATDFVKMRQARELLLGVQGNAAFLLREGRSDKEVMQYLIQYLLIPYEHAPKYLEFLKNPFREAYIFTYFYGKQLMRPWLKGIDRHTVFRRFLTEQIYPSELEMEKNYE